MSTVSSYNGFIESQKRVSTNLVKPLNVYRISSYDYVNEGIKSLTGNDSSLVFVFGIFEKKVECLKISEVQPQKFFKWLNTVKNPRLTEQNIENSVKLDELLVKSDLNGKSFYNSYIKTNFIYQHNPRVYRSYILKNIKYISEVQFKKDTLKTLLL